MSARPNRNAPSGTLDGGTRLAASPIDVRAMAAKSMMERMAKMGPGGASPDAAGAQLSQQLSELKGADPQLLSKAGEQVKAMLLAIQVRTAFQVPEAARHAAAAQKSIDSMLKALQQASATANTVSSPIVNNAGMSGAPGMQGGEQQGEVMTP